MIYDSLEISRLVSLVALICCMFVVDCLLNFSIKHTYFLGYTSLSIYVIGDVPYPEDKPQKFTSSTSNCNFPHFTSGLKNEHYSSSKKIILNVNKNLNYSLLQLIDLNRK